MSGQINIRQSLEKAYRKQRPTRAEIELLRYELIKMLDEANPKKSEEYHKGLLKDFLKNSAYADYFINVKDRSDLVIHNGKNSKSNVGVIIETKGPSNRTEMPTADNLNKKAIQELLLYFLRERVTKKNFDIKHLIATNLYEWFIFNAHEFEKFAEDKKLRKRFIDFENKRLSSDKTGVFYKEIASPVLEQEKNKITFTHFNIRDYEKHLKEQINRGDNKLIELQKVFSPTHLLKLPFANDSNTLNKDFYNELLHLIGLEEYKEKSKKLIRRKQEGNRNEDSFIEAAIAKITSLDRLSQIEEIERFGDNLDEQLYNIGLELAITWINRILFLKLLESQIVSYHESNDYLFLNKVEEYDDLETLFFDVLAVETKKRRKTIKEKFPNVPYLNSSLFEPTDLEKQAIYISNLPDDTNLPLYKKTKVKSDSKKMNTLKYLLKFLDAYDFASEGKEAIAEENKTLINASVLGLIFEKINGYKDGSFFTPGFITMYMCRETIRRSVVQKFKEQTDFDCDTFGDLINFTKRKYKIAELKKYNEIVNSLKICDPAVGSGHFLVSALNEIIAVKAELEILTDENGKLLGNYAIEVHNDELMILDSNGDFFKYSPENREAQRIQKTLFNEKQTIIENCLFGVDINPNSVKICRLRLWIELLKNAYYKADDKLETLPNIDINIKCGNSLISRYPIDADLGHSLVGSAWDIGMYRLAVMNYRNAENKEQKREAEKIIEKIKSDFHIGITENEPIRKKRKKIKEELNDLTSQGRLFGQDAFKKDKKIVKRIETLTKDITKLDAMIEDIKSGAVYKNAFEWRFEFPEVLEEKTGDFNGFDIIIANPPYGVKIDTKVKYLFKNQFNDVHMRMPDTYVYFISQAFKLSAKKSLVNLIVPNNLFYQNENEKARQLLLNKHLISAFNLGDNVFVDANVPTCIYIAENQNVKKYKFNYADYRSWNGDLSKLFSSDKIKKTDSSKVYSLPSKVFGVDNESITILEKVKGKSVTINEIAKEMACGISTGGDKIFRIPIDFAKHNQFDLSLLKKVLIGREVHKYSYHHNNHFIIYMTRQTDISRYSNIQTYLSQYKQKLSTRSECKSGILPWFALNRHRTKQLFEGKKIIIRQTADRIIATYDEEDFYILDSLLVLKLKNDSRYNYKFILAVLNSSFSNFIYMNFTQEEGRVFAQVKPKNIRKLPIPQIIPREQKPFVELVDKILATKKKDPQADTSELEDEIDQMVYKLYGLNDEERKIIDGK